MIFLSEIYILSYKLCWNTHSYRQKSYFVKEQTALRGGNWRKTRQKVKLIFAIIGINCRRVTFNLQLHCKGIHLFSYLCRSRRGIDRSVDSGSSHCCGDLRDNGGNMEKEDSSWAWPPRVFIQSQYNKADEDTVNQQSVLNWMKYTMWTKQFKCRRIMICAADQVVTEKNEVRPFHE